MTYSRVCESLNLSSGDLQVLAADPRFRIGYEIEFVAPFDSFNAPRSRSVRDIIQNQLVASYFKMDASVLRPYYDKWARDATPVMLRRAPTTKEWIKKGLVPWRDIWSRLDLKPLYGWADTQHRRVLEKTTTKQRISDAQEQVIASLKKLALPGGLAADRSTTCWQLTTDGSIESEPPNSGIGLELVSPPMNIASALLLLKNIFQWMETSGAETNHSTGFHVGVSLAGANLQQLDKLKLLLLLDEPYVAALFDRQLNSYTQSHVELLKKSISRAKRAGKSWLASRQATELTERLNAAIDLKKYRAVNFGKLEDGYLEFRIMGNQNYHKRFEEIERTIMRYCAVLAAALDPTMFSDVYRKEMGRLLAAALDAATPVYPDLLTKYAVLGAGPDSDRNRVLFDRAARALNQNNLSAATLPFADLVINANTYADTVEDPRVINAAASAYRLLLKRHHVSLDQLASTMQTRGFSKAKIRPVLHYLNTY